MVIWSRALVESTEESGRFALALQVENRGHGVGLDTRLIIAIKDSLPNLQNHHYFAFCYFKYTKCFIQALPHSASVSLK